MRVRDIIDEHKQGYYKHGKFESGNVHFVRISDIMDNAFLDETTTPMINVESNVIENFSIKKNDFLFARTGGAGRFCLIKEDVHGIFASYLIRLRLGNDYDANFMRYFFLSDSFQCELKSKIHGGVNQNVHAENIKDCKVPEIPIPEQKRIVQILDEAFAAIEKAKANTEKNLQNSRELFESYLNKIFSNPGEDWKEKKLEEVVTITSSKRIYKSEYIKSGVPFYRTKEIKELANGRTITTELFISESRYSEIKNRFGVPQKGDILVTAIGTIGEIYVVENGSPFYFKDGNVLWFKNLKFIEPNFLKFVLMAFVENLRRLSHGAAYNALPIEKLKNHIINFPQSLDEQATIVSNLATLIDETKKLESIYQQKLNDLEELKKSILQKAFNGELL